MKRSVGPACTILVCADVGPAGRFLLARKGIRLNWALTSAEAIASTLDQAPDLIVAREAFAELAMRHPMSLSPTLVLLDDVGGARARQLIEAGAAAIASVNDRQEVLDAVARLTKLSFRRSARVPFFDVVGIDTGGNYHFQETEELSAGGLSLRAWEGVEIGARVSVHFETLTPPLEVPAMVVRVGSDPAHPTVGLAFEAMPAEDRVVLEELHSRLDGSRSLSIEPEGLTTDLQTYTLDLFASGLTEAADAPYQAQLIEALKGGRRQQRLPRWLTKIQQGLTALEREALTRSEPTLAFAAMAVGLRISLGRARAERGGRGPDPSLAQAVLDFSRTLATEAEEQKAEILAQVAQIRGDLLVSVYGGLHKARRPRSAA